MRLIHPKAKSLPTVRHQSSTRSEALDRGSLAPWWHTTALIVLIVAVAITGILLQFAAAPSVALRAPASLTKGSLARISSQYLPLLLVNWGLTAYVSRLFRPHDALPELLGRRWATARRALTDLAFALALLLVIQAFEALSVHELHAGRNAALRAVLPSTEAERLTWVLVALSVGFCEEVVYRGYLQQQLTAFTGRPALGIALQALLFGIAHAEQGVGPALRIALYGLALGVLAHYRKSLLPGIACHVAIDLASALPH